MPEEGPARVALDAHGGVLVTESTHEAVELANASAAEHLVVDDDATAAQIRQVGSLFVGRWSAQVAGDYAIGSNHVLPTAGAARVRGGLSAADFVRQITVQRLDRRGLEHIGQTVMDLAEAEGLRAHAGSIAVRVRRTTAHVTARRTRARAGK
jgi:histidinol dehydrogenase